MGTRSHTFPPFSRRSMFSWGKSLTFIFIPSQFFYLGFLGQRCENNSFFPLLTFVLRIAVSLSRP
ncbi:hypothetical protein B0T26DRAFT_690350 [Lasiosphaeria miniovina]|uniref:Uncharacterized protein n=1 Tax=Lasiosphaeria miniovina TaxID=1954250 RepID=A0AA40BIS5_9PEZI|nr:uncharacterized protein B0T26DRAFT_690350 [Lasiosphaeria miniovina]KAK0734985.1 hypothetical protein B0T26DRAFT_690350 [Lasiosphaeria miniovina]